MMGFKFHNHALYDQILGFSKDVYLLSGRLPDYEQLGLIAHLRGLATEVAEETAVALTRQKAIEVESGLKHIIYITSKITASIDLCRKLNYIDEQVHTRTLTRCEEVIKLIHESKDN